MNHFMCDLETMSLADDGAIVSIGLVEFDETSFGRNFYVNVDLQSCIDAGLKTSQSTIDWWAKQEQAAIDAWKVDAVPLLEALTRVNRYLELATGGLSSVRLWGNGAGFDNVLLKKAYHVLEVDEPWKYYNNRCYRTMHNLFPLTEEETPPRFGTYHNALDDAITQATRLQVICAKYGIKLS